MGMENTLTSYPNAKVYFDDCFKPGSMHRVDTVYLCDGPHSEVYHKTSHCTGLRKCGTEIEAVDITTAKARHRRECMYCYH